MGKEKMLKKVESLFAFLETFNVKGKCLLFKNVKNTSETKYLNESRMGDLVQIGSNIYPARDIEDIVIYFSDKHYPENYSPYMGFEIIFMDDDIMIGHSYQVVDNVLYFDEMRVFE